MENYKMFIDDERYPMKDGSAQIIDDTMLTLVDKNYVIVRTFKDAVRCMSFYGCPSFISFDHDLGLEEDNETVAESGYDIAKWLIEKDLVSEGEFIPADFDFQVHSMNPIGRENIISHINNYLKFKNK